jgi:hypothetical protein
VKVTLTNNSQEAAFHGLRFSGPDRVYGNSDDFVLANIDPGVTDSVVIRYDAAGEYEFRSEQAVEGVTPVTGKVIVGQPEATPPPDATPTPQPADLSLNLSVNEAAFDPVALTVEAGKTFRITVTNGGGYVHKVRIAGPDGVFETDDDIVGVSVNPGGLETLPAKSTPRGRIHSEMTSAQLSCSEI